MADDDLRKLIESTAADTRRHFDETAQRIRAELREDFEAAAAQTRAELRHDFEAAAAQTRAELRQDFEASATRTRTEMRRDFEVTAESLRGEIRILAEAVSSTATNARVDRLEARMTSEFDDVRALVRLSYTEVDRRLRMLEETVATLKARLDRLEASTN